MLFTAFQILVNIFQEREATGKRWNLLIRYELTDLFLIYLQIKLHTNNKSSLNYYCSSHLGSENFCLILGKIFKRQFSTKGFNFFKIDKNSNDHLKVNESRCKQCGIIHKFPPGKIFWKKYCKKINIINWEKILGRLSDCK